MRVLHRHKSEQMEFELSISDDKLKLFAKVQPQPNHASVSDNELLDEILKVTVQQVVDLDVVNDITRNLREGRGCEERRVAKGGLPMNGRDGKVVWLVRRFRPGSGIDSGRELSDFYNLGLFENIEMGREVARVYKPTAGTEGIDVSGRVIPAKPGKPAVVKFDRTIEFKTDENREDYQTLIATVAGYAHEEGDKVTIRDVLAISGNLDYETGHIDFVGSVRIAGDVQKGFHIKARKDIEIVGSVLGENQLTSDGSIIVRGYHQGGKGSGVKAGVNYTVSIAQGVVADVGGNIIIQREARDCSFRSSAAVLAPDATIIGGTIWCVKGFEGKNVGNSAGVTTVLELRNELEVTSEYRRVEEKIKKHEVALAALELHIGPYLQNRKRVPLLTAKFKAKITELLSKYDAVFASLQRLQDAMKKMREGKPIEELSKINILGVVNPGVVFKTATASMEFQDSQKGPIGFKPLAISGEWASEEYQPLQKE